MSTQSSNFVGENIAGFTETVASLSPNYLSGTKCAMVIIVISAILTLKEQKCRRQWRIDTFPRRKYKHKWLWPYMIRLNIFLQEPGKDGPYKV